MKQAANFFGNYRELCDAVITYNINQTTAPPKKNKTNNNKKTDETAEWGAVFQLNGF